MKPLFPILLALMLCTAAQASPGAHGPNGEHLDAPTAAIGTGAPRIETFTEDFELVGNLSGGELSVLIDRYATNEPVLKGTLEVQYKGIKSTARFHADAGDFSFDDKKLIDALSAPGKHALVFTFVSGDQSDLLEGTLEVPDHDNHGGPAQRRWLWLGAGVAAAGLAGAAYALRRRTRAHNAGSAQGGQP